jgi:hypothetical protein
MTVVRFSGLLPLFAGECAKIAPFLNVNDTAANSPAF